MPSLLHRYCIATRDGGHSSLLLIASGVKEEEDVGPWLMSAPAAAYSDLRRCTLWGLQKLRCVQHQRRGGKV